MPENADYIELAKKLLVQAQKGDAKSQYHLGVLYNDGKGVPKDYEQAASWYLKAAQQGHQKAQLYLGLLYQNGRGVQQDYKRAAQWFTKSAEQGEQKAQFFLGVLYYKGIGVAQDLEQAANWLEQSANQGNTEAQKLLDEILSIPDIEDIDAEEFDPYDDVTEEFNDTEQAIPSRTGTGLIWAAILGVLFMVIAAGGAWYYFFLRKEPGNSRASQPRIIDSLYPRQNASEDSIDVFKLAETGTPQQLKEALRIGANFNVKDEGFEGDGENPLHRAARYNHNAESIRFLIAQGLNVNAEISNGEDDTVETPLSYAVSEGNYEAVSELLRAGADYNLYSSNGNMFQAVALSNRYTTPEVKRVIEALIRAGGNVNAHRQADSMKTMLLPREQWTSLNPFDNIITDAEHEDILSFKFSCTALICAVLKDNPDFVNFLLDLKADPNILSMEGKTAFDYAQELPMNAKLRKREAFERLKKLTTGRKKNNYDIIDNSSRKQLDSLLKTKKVPDYVRDSGKFYFNRKYNGGSVMIQGINVRLRSQPNTQSRIVAEGWDGMWIDNHNLYYLGEWTNPKGERWVVADYEGYKNGKPIRKQPVWVFGKYTELMTEKEFNEMMTIELSGE